MRKEDVSFNCSGCRKKARHHPDVVLQITAKPRPSLLGGKFFLCREEERHSGLRDSLGAELGVRVATAFHLQLVRSHYLLTQCNISVTTTNAHSRIHSFT